MTKIWGGTTCKGASTVTYIIASPAIFPYFTNMLIDTFDPLLSDKVNIAPGPEVTTTKKIPQADSSHNEINKANSSPTYKPTWEGDKMISFKNAFQLQEVLKITNSIDESRLTKQDLDDLAQQITKIFQETGCDAGVMNAMPNSNGTSTNTKIKGRKAPKKPWFNPDCEHKRKSFYRAKNKLKSVGSAENKIALQRESNIFKKTLKNAKQPHQKEIHERLINLKTSDPKNYWKILNEACGKKTDTLQVTIQAFEEHFRGLNHQQNENVIHNTDSNEDMSTGELNNSFLDRPFTSLLVGRVR